MASQCDVGTDEDIVAEPVFADLSSPAAVAQMREWALSATRRINAQQRSIVCMNAEITRLEALITAGDATSTANAAAIATLQAETAALDGHDHEILIGTAAGGDAVEFAGGVDGTLDAPAGSGGNARTEVFDIP